MKITRYLFLAFAAVVLLSMGTYGQVRRPARRSTTAAKTVAMLPPLDVRAARVKVSNQLANVSAFISRLGPVAAAIEALDAEAANKRFNKQSVDKNEADKQKVIAAIRGLRDGMVKLESEFRLKAALKKYMPTIQGISDLAGQSETSAIGGEFVAANGPLRTVQQKLKDTLAAMPNADL
ncbi:MAG: hypothetical protein ABIO91_00685 [Pyrinomonadaceae bacterium]